MKTRVLVKDRRSGKTTELIRWLLQGHEQMDYPRWTRVIVTPQARMVPFTARMVAAAVLEMSVRDICTRSLPHLRDECTYHHDQVRQQIRKAVWSFNDLNRNMQGGRYFEYGVDDIDIMLAQGIRFPLGRPPAVLVMTGEAVDSLCD